MELLVSSAISFATTKEQHQSVLRWFTEGKITAADGSEYAGSSVNVKLRHTMVRKMFASKHLEFEQAKASMEKLAELDESDMTQRTKWYCSAAMP